MEKRWQLRERGNESVVEKLSAELNIDSVLTNLLVQRGIDTFEKARTFFRPQLSDMYDPFLMKDMNIAIDRIGSAMARNEKILVYGDYDVDGTTSVALIYAFFRQFYQNMGYYIPNRYAEGYGISFKSIDYAAENNYSLIIALDCGIKAIDKVEYAARKKLILSFVTITGPAMNCLLPLRCLIPSVPNAITLSGNCRVVGLGLN